MNAYQNLYQPWRSAIAIWSVLAQAQTEFALRLMGISARTVVKGVVAEAALLTLVGSALGVGIGLISSEFINWYYQGVYRTPLHFSLITPSIVAFAVALSLVLGVLAGLLASLRLVRTPPLALFGR